MVRRIVVLGLVSLVLRPAGGAGAAARASRESVMKMLGASERTPNERELRALGSDVDLVLIGLARDPKLEAKLRGRAVSALAFAPTAASRSYLGRLVSEAAAAKDAADLVLIRRAAMALGWQGGPSAPPLLGPLLEHPDPETRIDAALALGLTRVSAAADLLRTRLDVETDARVRGNISRQLRVIESALGMQPASGAAP
jgi:HEAT repeat protein